VRQKAESWLLFVGAFDHVVVAALLAGTWRFDLEPTGLGIFLVLLVVPFWTYLHGHLGLYDSHRLDGWRSVSSATLTASTIGFLVIAAVLWLAGLQRRIPEMAQFAALWIGLVFVSRAGVYGLLRFLRRRGADQRRACIIGDWETAVELAERFDKRPEWGLEVSIVGVGSPDGRTFYRFIRTFGGGTSGPSDLNVLGHDLEAVLRDHVVDEILIAAHPRDVDAEQETIQLCKTYGIQCRVYLPGDQVVSEVVDYIPGHLAWTVYASRGSLLHLAAKRTMDVILSATLLVVLSPFFLVLAGLVKLSSPGPVFYTQRRAGLRGREFVLLKFRTMVVDADAMLHLVAHRNIAGGPVFKDQRDWRVTDIGRILRRTSLDELPQLANVLLGDMSLVGPRPLPLHESAAIEGEFRRRFNMKPGITCRWQVQGRSEIGFREWMQLDVDYVDNWSLVEDLKLLLLTIPAVLTGKGAY
jgi:exopolysaccharide biosynthesis polyprenyl glycosylphosphotransferase